MPRWYQIAERQFHSAGLLEPRTKMAQLRAFLPVIESALEHGSTYWQCVENLKLCGVDMSLSHFRNALSRARRLGPLRPLVDPFPDQSLSLHFRTPRRPNPHNS